jgi:hypothetical protein
MTNDQPIDHKRHDHRLSDIDHLYDHYVPQNGRTVSKSYTMNSSDRDMAREQTRYDGNFVKN